MNFYRTLGFSAHSYKNGDNYAFLGRGQIEVHLRIFPDLDVVKNPTSTYFVIKEGGAAALEAEFKAAGVHLTEPLTAREWKMREFVLHDLDGNQLIFGENIPDI
jgi:hypothetical protein